MINLRPSSVGGFHDCQFRWFNIHVLGVKSWSGFAAVRGTGVHSAAELIWSESIKQGEKKFSLNDAKDAAAQSVKDSFDSDTCEVRLYDFETKEGAIDFAVSGAEVYASEIVPNVSIPASVETYLKANISDNISMNGTFDALGEDGTIRDIKTSGKKATPSKFIDQMSVYARLAEVNGLKPNMEYSIENIVFLKNDIKAHILQGKVNIPATQLKIDDMVQRYKWYTEHPEDGHMVYPANTSSYLCNEKYCPVFNECYLRNKLPL